MKITFHLLIDELNDRIRDYHRGKNIRTVRYFLMRKMDKTGLMQIILKIPGSPSFVDLANMKKADMVNIIVAQIRIREWFSVGFNYKDGVSLTLGDIKNAEKGEGK